MEQIPATDQKVSIVLALLRNVNLFLKQIPSQALKRHPCELRQLLAALGRNTTMPVRPIGDDGDRDPDRLCEQGRPSTLFLEV